MMLARRRRRLSSRPSSPLDDPPTTTTNDPMSKRLTTQQPTPADDDIAEDGACRLCRRGAGGPDGPGLTGDDCDGSPPWSVQPLPRQSTRSAAARRASSR